MKKIILLSLVIFFYSCSTSTENNLDLTNLHVAGNDVTDYDGNIYNTIVVDNCNQTWTKSNLNVSHYRNGDIIPQVTDDLQWATLTTGAWCYYNNDPTTETIYGKLYNWYAVNDQRGLAPLGFHIPSDTEWSNIADAIGGESVAGGKMKEVGDTYWGANNNSATNTSGFTGLPGGYRYCNGNFGYGTFGLLGNNGFWWSSTIVESSNSWSWARNLDKNNSVLNKKYFNNKIGLSVRCIKN